VAVLIICILYCWYNKESFYACPCEPGENGGAPIQARDMTVVNPYIYPYSAYPCIENIYENGLKMELEFAPLTHLSVPDHSPKSN